ncbi:MAG: thioredoxin [Clostridia bacterium]|nr:thioredoxin [Clostridia bacterium]
MMVEKITKKIFDEKIATSEKTVLIDFYAEWCGPCKMIAPIVHELAEENPDITVVKVDVDEETPLALEFGVQSIPTLVVMKNGKVANKAIGFRSKEQLLELIK